MGACIETSAVEVSSHSHAILLSDLMLFIGPQACTLYWSSLVTCMDSHKPYRYVCVGA